MPDLTIGTAAKSFPRCPVGGSVIPVQSGNARATVLSPQKCVDCQYEFQCECVRPGSTPDHYMDMDWGFCGIYGGDNLGAVEVEVRFKKVRYDIPKKCTTCKFLDYSIMHKLQCTRIMRTKTSGISLDWSEISDGKILALHSRQIAEGATVREIVNLPIGRKEPAPPKIRPVDS
jgi:hypothetical protein